MSYIESARASDPGCLFCRKPSEGDDRRAFLLERQGSCFTLLNAYPYNSGHLMVAPFRHVDSFAALSSAERTDLLLLLARAEVALRREYRPHGFNMGVNLGEAAGAGVLGHLHAHLVPRWTGDTNFMTAVGETKVLPEGLDRTFERLERALSEIEVA
jgi:ATP adenylyltransferase